jgi:hypothetical protein
LFFLVRLTFFSFFISARDTPSCITYYPFPYLLALLLSHKSSTIPLRKRFRVVARTTSNAVTLIIPDKGPSSSSSLPPPPPTLVKQNHCNCSSSSSNSNSSSHRHCRRRRRRLRTPYTTSSADSNSTAVVVVAAAAAAVTTAETTTTTTITTVPSTAAGMETQDTSMTNLIINYLPQSMTDKKLHQMFTQIGQIEACRVMKDVKVSYKPGNVVVWFICVRACLRM